MTQHTNRYFEAAAENLAQIEVLKERIERFREGPRAHRIPAIEAEIEKLTAQIPTLRGTGKLVQQMYG